MRTTGPRLAVLLLLALAANTAGAQALRVPAQVTGVAGAEAYLDRGTADGLAQGDTVSVERDGADVGELVVLAATAGASVATFAGAPFAITRGERLVLVLHRTAPAEPEPTPADSARVAEEARASLFESPPTSARATRARPRLSGRVQSGMLASRSSTQPKAGAAVDRTFASPFVSLRAEVVELPAGARLRLDGRSTYRYSDAPGAASHTDLQVYTAAVEMGTRLVHLHAGRFYPDFERLSGYWDGASVRVGTNRAGVGTAIGFQPDRTNGLPSADLPKAAAFAYAAHRDGPIRADGAVSFGHMFSTRGATFGGATGSASYRSGTTLLRAFGSFLADGDADAGVGLSRATLRGSGRLGLLDASVAYSRYRPSALTAARLPLGVVLAPIVRETLTGRLGVRLGARGPEVYATAGSFHRDGEADGTALGGGLRVSRLPTPLPLGLSLDATTRHTAGRRSLYASARATTTLGPASVALGYRLSQSDDLTEERTSRGFEGSLSAPLSRTLGVSLLGGVSGGGGLARTSLYTSVWARL